MLRPFALAAVFALVPSAGSAEEISFRFDPPGDADVVYLAGEFNNWNPTGRAMTDEDGDGVFDTSLDLPPGRYQYKFVAGGQWYEDPTAKEKMPDGFGGNNSVVVVGGSSDQGRFVGGGTTVAPIPAAVTPGPTGGSLTPAPASGVAFRWTPSTPVRQANLAGEFNQWSTTATPMRDDDGDGTWEVTVHLAPGRHAYKFVADGSNWHADPNAAESLDDGYGGKNSVVVVGEGSAAPAPAAAAAAALPAAGGELVEVSFRYAPVISGIRTCHLVGQFNAWNQTATPMYDTEGDGAWEVTVKLAPGKHPYKFLVDGTNWLEDPNATESVDDGYGGKNSVVRVGSTGDAKGPTRPRRVTFAHRPSSAPRELSLAGTFNNWTVGKTPMSDGDGDGTWSVTLLLPEDTYQYKFVADGAWITDEKAEGFADDGFGGKNSVIEVDSSFPGVDVARGDGKILTDELVHRQTPAELNRVSDERLEITAKAYANDVTAVSVEWDTGIGTPVHVLRLEPIATDATWEYWRGCLERPDGAWDLRYEIHYTDGAATLVQARGGDFMAPDERGVEGEGMFVYTEDRFPRFATPDWVRDGLVYQIFPERFANGDPSNDPGFSEPYYAGRTSLPPSGKKDGEYYHLVKDWYDVSSLSRSPYRNDGKPDYFSFYGGDIEGVRQKLDYLEDLGVTIIYFNPLFQARSNHKYEAYDYKSIDPHFGTSEEFRRFVDEAHGRGIRIVVDWVINHLGDHSPYFQDTVKKGHESKYWNWFEWNKWPLPAAEPADWREFYECWWGFAHMPDLNYDLSRKAAAENGVADVAQAEPNQPVVDYVLESARWWLQEMDVDGFRLDVPNEVPFWVWRIFRQEVHRIEPEAYLVGEIWSDAGDWVSPTCFDAAMNYKYFKDPVTDFIGKGRIDAARFDSALEAGRLAYPTQATQVMMNLVDSHDTPRYLTATGGDVRRLHLTALFQMTYVGAPHIYYGDEIAMRGEADPDCRRPFDWKWAENPDRAPTHQLYRTLAHLRRDHRALTSGEFHTLLAEGPLYAFARRDETETFVVVMNVSDRAAEAVVPVAQLDPSLAAAVFQEAAFADGEIQAAEGVLHVKLAPVSGRIFRLGGSS